MCIRDRFNTNWRVNSFSSNYDGLTSNCATVIIDSDTGKVVDVMTPNPLYDLSLIHISRFLDTRNEFACYRGEI